jgi:hypothetical protein
LWYRERLGRRPEELGAALVVDVSSDRRSDKRAGVDDDYRPNPLSEPSSSCSSSSATLTPSGVPSNMPMNDSDARRVDGT